MSRGLGKIQRGIMAAFEAEPDNALTTDDLIDRIFPDLIRPEKKHRVSVCRTMRSMAGERYGLAYAHHSGGTLVIYDRLYLPSFAMGQLKASAFPYYRSRAGNSAAQAAMDALPIADQEQRLRAMTWPGGKYHPHFMTGGLWAGSVALAVARRDGDEKAAAAIEADMASRLTAARAALGISSEKAHD